MVTAVRQRTLTLSSGGGSLDLQSPEFAAVQGGSGFGSPKRQVRWFEGAGDGARYRGVRILRRSLVLPTLVRASADETLDDLMSRMMRVLDPRWAPARLTLQDSTDAWWVDVVCSDGGDWVDGKDSDGSSWIATTLTLDAGDPYWTRQEAAVQPISPGGIGRGLLGTGRSLSQLRLSSSQAIGTVTLENPGDADAAPVVTINGPATSLLSANDLGETLTWAAVLTEGQSRVIDHRAGTVVDPAHLGDPDGGNRYNELGAAPRFWRIPPGLTVARFELQGATAASGIRIEWQPRRWVVA